MALKEKILDRAQKFIQKGYLDKAIAEYRAAFDLDPKDTTVRLRIGELYVKMGMKAEAVKEYVDAARANSQRGFNLKAIAVYKQALKLDETNLDIHNRLAELYAKQRLIADAISEYGYIVSAFEKKNRTNEALELIKKMVEVDPENTGVRLKLAEYYQKLGFDKDAISEYSGIFSRLVSQGKPDRAEKIYAGLYNSHPNDTEILRGLAEVNKIKGDTQQFLRFSGKLASIYAADGDNDKAKEVYDQILEAKPNDPDGLSFMKRYKAAMAREVKPQIKAEAVAPPTPIEAPPVVEAPAQVAPPPPVEEPPLIEIEFPQEAAVAQEQAPPAAAAEAGEPPLIEFEFPEAAPETQGAQEEIEIALSGFEEAVGEEKKTAEAPEEKLPIEPLIELEPAAPAAEEIKEAEAPALQPQAPQAAVEEIEIPIIEMPPVEEAAAEAGGIEIAIEAQAPEQPRGEAAYEIAPEPPIVEQAPAPEVSAEEVAEHIHAEQAGIPVEAASFVEQAVEAPVREAVEPPAQEAPEQIIEEPAPLKVEEALEEELARGAEQEAPEPVHAEARPRTPEEEEKAEEAISEAITELLEKYEPKEPAPTAPAQEIKLEEGAGERKAEKEEYVDLSVELGIENEIESLAGTLLLGESKETLDEFKTGLEKQLGKEDSETHYNLGIAYMEMELFKEAANEFKIALKDPGLEFDCYTRLGLCANSGKNPDDAILFFLKALRVEGRSNDERMGVMYELALSYEAANNREEALELFRSIYKADPQYREVARKIAQPGGVEVEGPSIPYDDNLIEVELL